MSDENMLFATEEEQAAELDKKELTLSLIHIFLTRLWSPRLSTSTADRT